MRSRPEHRLAKQKREANSNRLPCTEEPLSALVFQPVRPWCNHRLNHLLGSSLDLVSVVIRLVRTILIHGDVVRLCLA
jgi:hypothetical protein